MAKVGVGGTKYIGKKRHGGFIDVPQQVLAELANRPVPEVLRVLPKYPPGDPRNGTLASSKVAAPTLLEAERDTREAIARQKKTKKVHKAS
jgi:hypothetical protein